MRAGRSVRDRHAFGVVWSTSVTAETMVESEPHLGELPIRYCVDGRQGVATSERTITKARQTDRKGISARCRNGGIESLFNE